MGIANVISSEMPAGVRAALTEQAGNLARGIDPAIRPADVQAIADARPAMWRGSLSTEDAHLAQSLVSDALKGLTPRIQTNTTVTRATDLLRDNGRLGNAYDKLQDSTLDWATLSTRLTNGVETRVGVEKQLGMFGTGTTVYGAVTFSDIAHRPMLHHSGKVIREAEKELNTGATMYGDASLVLGDRALNNATFLPADTGIIGGQVPLRAREQLADVVTERMILNYQLGSDPKGLPSSYENVFDADVRPAKLAKEFESMIHLPHDDAVAAIREHLTSRAMADSYIEAQVRIANADDVVAVHARKLPSNQIMPEMQHAYDATFGSLRHAAESRGVAYRLKGDPLPSLMPDQLS